MLAFNYLSLLAYLVMNASGFNLIMQLPSMGITVEKSENYTLLCLADVPLVNCEIKSFLRQSVSVAADKLNILNDGLSKGECGIFVYETIKAANYRSYTCRGRTATSGWKYDTGMVRIKDDGRSVKYNAEEEPSIFSGISGSDKNPVTPITMGPQKVYVEQGSNVELNFETVLPIKYCAFKWPGKDEWTDLGTEKNYTIIDGEKTNGKCGLKLLGLTGPSSGFVEADVRTANGGFMQITTVIVKTAPSPPVLKLNKHDGFYNNTDYLQATCFVGPGRPVARIEWLLGDDIIRNDQYDDSDLGTNFKWEYEARSITQGIILKLTKDDIGKELICRAEHIAWKKGRIEARKRILLATVSSANNTDILLYLTWLLVGLASVSLCVAIVVLCLLFSTYASRTWCFEIPEQ